MGCGQSKINLYPRRNKNGGKGNSAKKSGAADKETDEEEGGTGGEVTPGSGSSAGGDPKESDSNDPPKLLLPLAASSPAIEVSASQQDFFKMLDDKIDKGRDYDSSSENEQRQERERRTILIQQWRSASQSSEGSRPSPPTPARRRRADQHSPRRCPGAHSAGSEPPSAPRRCLQQHPQQLNGDWQDPCKSPQRRPYAGTHWRANPKVAPFPQKRKVLDGNENQRPASEPLETVEDSSQDISQITYNPTFQTHSPAHAPHKPNASSPQQPYIAQIITYPVSQQAGQQTQPKFIAPPEPYQDQQNDAGDPKYTNLPPHLNVAQVSPQARIYHIYGNPNSNAAPDLSQQRQQTAMHLQQYVAMKQAQQQMFGYIQRTPHTVYPNVDGRGYDEEGYATVYGARRPLRPHSAPVNVVRPMPITPGINPLTDVTPLVHQISMWSQITPVVTSFEPWPPGQVPLTEVHYYQQAQLMQNMYRAGSAGSAGTLTRYQKDRPLPDAVNAALPKNNVCQSINLVRQKPVGQIVVGGQDSNVCQNENENANVPVPASGSGDEAASTAAGASRPAILACNSAVKPVENKNKKSKSVTFNSRILKSSKSVDSKD